MSARKKQPIFRLTAISTIAVSVSAVFAIIAFFIALQTTATLQAITEALQAGEFGNALSLLFDISQPPNEMALVGSTETPESPTTQCTVFERIYSGCIDG